MVRFFAKNDIIAIIALFFYTALIKLYVLFYPVYYTAAPVDSYLGHVLSYALDGRSILIYLLTVLLTFFQGAHINILTNNSRMYYSQSGYAGLFYVLLTSLSPDHMAVSPPLIAMSFFLFAVQSVFSVYKKANVATQIFNAALLVSIATIIYPPCMIMFLVLFIELFLLRSLKLKEQLQYLCGFLVVIWIVGVAFHYAGVLTLSVLSQFSIGGSLGMFLVNTPDETIILVSIGLLCLFIMLNYYSYFKKKEIETRKKIEFLFWIMISSLITVLVFSGMQPHFVIFLMLPISILMAITLHTVGQKGRVELIHFTMLILVLFLQYNQLIMVDI